MLLLSLANTSSLAAALPLSTRKPGLTSAMVAAPNQREAEGVTADESEEESEDEDDEWYSVSRPLL